MSILTYNGVTLSYCRTSQFAQEPQWSEDRMEYLYTKVTLEIEAVLNNKLNPSVAAETPTQTMVRVHELLSLPRKALTFTVNAQNLLNVVISTNNGGDGLPTMDAKGGPTPLHLNITQITEQTFLVNYAIEVNIVECPGGGAPPLYASNRFRISESIDETFHTKQTVNGRLIVRGDVADPITGFVGGRGINPDTLRYVVCPQIPAGFKRVSSDYMLAEDGLSLEYTFVDQEIDVPPPLGTCKADIDYMESTPFGPLRFAECTCRLEGSKAMSKLQMLKTAIFIVLSKVAGPSGQLFGLSNPNGRTQLQQAALREKSMENKIEFSAKVKIVGLNAQTCNFSGNINRFTFLPAGVGLQFGGSGAVATSIISGGGVTGATVVNGGQNYTTAPAVFITGDGAGATATASVAGGSVTGLIINNAGAGYTVALFNFGGQAPDPGLRGTAGLLAVAGALNDPCLMQSILTANPTGYTSSLQGFGLNTQPASTLSTVPQLPDYTPAYQSTLTTGMYDDYPVRSRYVTDMGVIQLPVTSSDPNVTAVFIQMHAPIAKRIVDMDVSSTGSRPQLPQDPALTDSNQVLLSSELAPDAMNLSGDGITPTWRMRGSYEIGFVNRNNASVTAAVPPWLSLSTLNVGANPDKNPSWTTADFITGILDTTTYPSESVLEAGGVGGGFEP